WRWRIARVDLEEDGEGERWCRGSVRPSAGRALHHILRDGVFGCFPQFLRCKGRPIVLERARRGFNHAAGCPQRQLAVVERKDHPVPFLYPKFSPDLRRDGNLPLAGNYAGAILPCFTRCTVIYRHYIRLCRSTRQHRGFHLPRSQLEPAATRLEPPAGLESRGPAAAAPGSGCRRGSWLGREELELLDGPFAA